jgi:hypothetical protein
MTRQNTSTTATSVANGARDALGIFFCIFLKTLLTFISIYIRLRARYGNDHDDDGWPRPSPLATRPTTDTAAAAATGAAAATTAGLAGAVAAGARLSPGMFLSSFFTNMFLKLDDLQGGKG